MILAHGNDLTVTRGAKTLLDSVSVDVEAGELTVVVGPNGAGKSTLLRVLSGELAPTRGHVRLFDRALEDWDPRVLARRRAVVSQHVQVAFPWNVGDLVALGRLPHDTSAAENDRIVHESLARVGLGAFADRNSSELSGGELQRVHLARAVAQLAGSENAVLLLDEPTASLDPAHQHETLRLAHSLSRQGHGVLCILHDLGLAARYADRVLVLKNARCARQGLASEVLEAELLAEVFEVRTFRHTHHATGEEALFVLGPTTEQEPRE